MSVNPSDLSSTISVVGRWGSVFDRLYDPATYTGVYAERFRSGPGINNDAEHKLHHHVSQFEGNTNTKTNEHIKDIKFITRPNLNRDRTSLSSPTGRAAAKARARYEASERALLAALSPGATQASLTMPSVYVLPTDGGASGSGVGLGFSSSSPRSSRGGGGATTPSSPAAAASSRALDTNVMLQLLFQYYCRFGRTSGMSDESDSLDSFNFAKFTRECPALLEQQHGNNLNPTEVDLIFVKCRSKGFRRLHYAQWLDALSAMATIKYPEVDDPAAAFSLFLTTHVFTNPAAIGISQLARTGLISVDSSAGGEGDDSVSVNGNGAARSTSRRSSRGGAGSSSSVAGADVDLPSTLKPADAGRFSAAAIAAGFSPSASRGNRHMSAPAHHFEASSSTSAASPSNASATAAATAAVNNINLPPELQNIPGIAEAVRAAAEALVKAQFSPSSNNNNNKSQQAAADADADAGSVRSDNKSSVGPAAASLHIGGYPAPPADVFELIRRRALEVQLQQERVNGPAAALSSSSSTASPTATTFHRPATITEKQQQSVATTAAIAAAIASAVQQQVSSNNNNNLSSSSSDPRQSLNFASLPSNNINTVNLPTSPRTSHHHKHPWSPSHYRAGGGGGQQLVTGAAAMGITGEGFPLARVVASEGASLETLDPVKSSPGGDSGIRHASTLGSPYYRPQFAGEAIEPGSVYERLTNPDQFTGIYKRAWNSGGYSTMNHGNELGVSGSATTYVGHTNTGTNQVVHDIRHTLRPNVSKGKSFKP